MSTPLVNFQQRILGNVPRNMYPIPVEPQFQDKTYIRHFRATVPSTGEMSRMTSTRLARKRGLIHEIDAERSGNNLESL